VTFRVEKWTSHQFKTIEHDAHLVCFGEVRPENLSRIDFALVVFNENNDICGYATCLEMDKETVYLQHGGVFPNYSKKHHVMFEYMRMVYWLKEYYQRAFTRVENTNIPYLKMALKAGFLIHGTYTFKGKIYLEMTNEFTHE
jgi:hypothetical protein